MIAIKKAALSAAVAVGMTLAGGTAVAYAAPSGGQQAGHDHGKGDPPAPPTQTPPPPPSGGDKDHSPGGDKDHNPGGDNDHNPGRPGDHRPGPGDHRPGDDHGRPGHPDPRHDHPVGDWRHDHPDWRLDHSRSHPGWHWYVNKGWWAGAVNARACRAGGGDPDFRHDECDGGRFDDWLLIR
jgi:hypothetical protein